MDRRLLCLAAAALLLAPALSHGGTVNVFKGGANEVTVYLAAPSFSTTVNFTVPAECYILNASVGIRTQSSAGNLSEYPLSPAIQLGGTSLWEFNYTGFGAFGRQTILSDGSPSVKKTFNAAGGNGSSAIRMPKDAVVKNATLQYNCSGPGSVVTLMSHTGPVSFMELGSSVAAAGDVNGDGYDDVIAGAPFCDAAGFEAGRAYIYFGGPSPDSVPDVTLDGTNVSDHFGWSVAGAGDVNGDGYDDVIVGAPNNDSAGDDAGEARVYFGGNPMNGFMDVVVRGNGPGDKLGFSVAGAGDFDGNGYDDVLIGEPYNDTLVPDSDTGMVFLVSGGPAMDGNPDFFFTGTGATDLFGFSVAAVGDVNNDSIPDIAIGSPGSDITATDIGKVSLFYGGPSIDTFPDNILVGDQADDFFGYVVSRAGDMNGDGVDDLLVGSPLAGSPMPDTGAVWGFYGGTNMDSILDTRVVPIYSFDNFGSSVAQAGDVNQDGFDDYAIGHPSSDNGGTDTGAVQIIFGSKLQDPFWDIMINGTASMERFGTSMASAGDFNGDGIADLVVGAPRNGSTAYFGGKAAVVSIISGLKGPAVSVGGTQVTPPAQFLRGSNRTADFASSLNGYLRSATVSATDFFGNRYVDVPVVLSASGEGNLTLDGLNIIYSCNATSRNFSSQLNYWLSAHKAESDPGGNLTVPLTVSARSAGSLTLRGLGVSVDEAPVLIHTMPDVGVPEDSDATDLVDLNIHFRDDFDPIDKLTFTPVVLTNSTRAAVTIEGGRFLRVDLRNGTADPNWTGAVSLRVFASDSRGLKCGSNDFYIIVTNVNDEPVIISHPPSMAAVGVEVVYQVLAEDGDRDTLEYGLAYGPANMSIDASTGRLAWIPSRSGRFNVSVTVDDGNVTVSQTFTVTVPGHEPRILSSPPGPTMVDIPYFYNISAIDEDGDGLGYTLVSGPSGMSIGETTGRVIWTPAARGDYMISITISDGTTTVYHNFTINVTEKSNRPPRFAAFPALNATAGVPFVFDALASDEDGDSLTYRIRNGPAGMSINTSTGRLTWTPRTDQTGRIAVVVAVGDGRGALIEQTLAINVTGGGIPRCLITFPAAGMTWGGRVTVRGTAAPGNAALHHIETRVDGGAWKWATGTDSWTFELDTGTLTDGRHLLEARATDGTVNSGIARTEFSVHNGNDGMLGAYTLPVIVIVVLLVAALGALSAVRRRKVHERTVAARTHEAPQASPRQGHGMDGTAMLRYEPAPGDWQLPYVDSVSYGRDEAGASQPYGDWETAADGSDASYAEDPETGGAVDGTEAPVEGEPSYTGEEAPAPADTEEGPVPTPTPEGAFGVISGTAAGGTAMGKPRILRGAQLTTRRKNAPVKANLNLPKVITEVKPKKKMPPPRPPVEEAARPAHMCPTCGTSVPVEGRTCRKCDAQAAVNAIEGAAAELENEGMVTGLIREGIQESQRALKDLNYEGAKVFADKVMTKVPVLRGRYLDYNVFVAEAKEQLEMAQAKGGPTNEAEASILLAESFARKGKYGKAGRYAKRATSLITGKTTDPRPAEKDED